MVAYKRKMAKYYNKRVHYGLFVKEDFILNWAPKTQKNLEKRLWEKIRKGFIKSSNSKTKSLRVIKKSWYAEMLKVHYP